MKLNVSSHHTNGKKIAGTKIKIEKTRETESDMNTLLNGGIVDSHGNSLVKQIRQ